MVLQNNLSNNNRNATVKLIQFMVESLQLLNVHQRLEANTLNFIQKMKNI